MTSIRRVYGMVFAAGLGTRLRPLTAHLPKPVVPVWDRPLAAFALERLAAFGVERAMVNTHHLPREVPGALVPWLPTRLRVRFVHEPLLLGTGGGLRNAMSHLDAWAGPSDPTAPVVVLNGDILFWPDLEGALALHRRLGALATMVLRPDPEARRFGAIEIDGTGRARRLLGRPDGDFGPLRELMFTGVHILSREAVRRLPPKGCIVREGYRRWIDEGLVVAGHVDESPWADLGTPRAYLDTHLDLLRGHRRWPGIEAPSSKVFAGPGCEIGSGAKLDEVVIGRGAHIAAGVELSRVVVWPGTLVDADATDAILASHARVELGAG